MAMILTSRARMRYSRVSDQGEPYLPWTTRQAASSAAGWWPATSAAPCCPAATGPAAPARPRGWPSTTPPDGRWPILPGGGRFGHGRTARAPGGRARRALRPQRARLPHPGGAGPPGRGRGRGGPLGGRGAGPGSPGAGGHPGRRQLPRPGRAPRRRGAHGRRPGRHRGRRRRQPACRPGRPGAEPGPAHAAAHVQPGAGPAGPAAVRGLPGVRLGLPGRARVRLGGAAPGLAAAGRGRRPHPGGAAGRRHRAGGAAAPGQRAARRHHRAVPGRRRRAALPGLGPAHHPPGPAPGAAAPGAARPPGHGLDGAARRGCPPAGDDRHRPRPDPDRHRHLLAVLRAEPGPDRRHLLQGDDHDHHRLRRHPPAQRAPAPAAVRRGPDAVGHGRPPHPVQYSYIHPSEVAVLEVRAMRLGGYVRNSHYDLTQERSDQDPADSPARQERDIRRLAEVRGDELVEVYRDLDLSAWSGVERPAFEQLLGDLAAGLLDGAIFWKLDRACRRLVDLERLLRLVERRGIALISVHDSIDTATASGIFTLRMMAGLAEMESSNTSLRVRWAMEEAAQNGKAHTGGTSRPFGYTDHSRQELHLIEYLVIREAVQRLLGGETLGSVVKAVNAARVRTPPSKRAPEGKAWRTGTFAEMLCSPGLAALRLHKGERYPGVWQPIVTREEHERLVAMRKDPGRIWTHAGQPRKHLLAGLLWCGRCGEKLHSKPVRGVPRYKCTPKPYGRGCGTVSISAAHVEGVVLERLWVALDTPELAEAIRAPA